MKVKLRGRKTWYALKRGYQRCTSIGLHRGDHVILANLSDSILAYLLGPERSRTIQA